MQVIIKRALIGVALGCAFFVGLRFPHDSPKSQIDHRAILFYQDPMHPAYRSDKPGIAPDCGMALEPVYADADQKVAPSLVPGTVQISPDQEQMIGLQVEKASSGPMRRRLQVLGKVAADDTRVDRIAAISDGVVRKVGPYSPGTAVRKDEVLATYFVASRDLYNAMQSFFLAAGPRDQAFSSLQTNGIIKSEKARARVEEELLASYGVTSTQIKELMESREITRDIEFRAPHAGIILDRTVSPGSVVLRGAELFRIADLSHVWVLADVFENDVDAFAPGASAKVRFNGTDYPAKVTEARDFDANSRTFKVRLEMDNPALRFRPDQFVNVSVDVPGTRGMSVPIDSVLDSGSQTFVFVSSKPGTFEPRPVAVGAQSGGRVEIKRGLNAGETVVVAGMFLLDSESRLRTNASSTTAKPEGSAKPAAPELSMTKTSTGDIDPVCGMPLNGKHDHMSDLHGRRYYFCSDDCKRKFDSSPVQYSERHQQS